MVLRDDSRVGFVDGHHLLNMLIILHQSTDMALQSMSDNFQVSNVSREREGWLPLPEISMLSW